MIVAKLTRTGSLAATILENKGITGYGVRWFADFLCRLGIDKVISFSDGEAALVALKTKAADQVQGLEAVPRECPAGDHTANADAESGVKQVKQMCRSLRLSFQKKLGQPLAQTDPVLQWIPHFAAQAITTTRKGKDGKTPWERETGRKWRRPRLQFGEKVMLREAREQASGAVKRDWQPQMRACRFVGYHARTSSIMGLSSDGLVLGTGVNRLP